MKSIFVSSTFRDMHHERDAIKKRIEPELNEYALQYGENVMLKDLRWGIDTQGLQDEEAEIKVLQTCLDEIDISRPYMIVLLGDRYGWTPGKERLQKATQGYNIQSFSENTQQETIHEDALFDMSVTALEIQYGALQHKDQMKQTLFYFRNIQGEPPQGYRGDPKEKQKLQELKTKIQAIAQEQQIKQYTLHFENGRPKKEDLDRFVTMVQQDIKTLMQKEWEEQTKLSETQQEIRRHQNYAEQKANQFQGREDLLQDCLQELKKGTKVFAIRGTTGSGKSTLLSKLSLDLKKQDKNVLPIFCGTTGKMTTASDVMIHIINYIGECYDLPTWQELQAQKEKKKDDLSAINLSENRPFEEKQNEPHQQLKETFQERIAYYQKHAKKSLVILIDAIDQLTPDELRNDLRFIPNQYRLEDLGKSSQEKPKIQILFSVLTQEENETNTSILQIPKAIWTKEISTIHQQDKKAILQGILHYLRRELHPGVIDKILQKPSAGNPLYLSLITQRLLMMDQEDFNTIAEQGDGIKNITAHQLKIIQQLPDDLKELTMDLIDTAAKQNDTDPKMIQKTIQYLATSRYGLREQDLEKLHQAQQIPWSSADFAQIKKYLSNLFLSRGDGRIDFAHKIIRQAVQEKLNAERIQKNHQEIISVLNELSLDDPVRKQEFIHHCQGAKDQDYFLNYLIVSNKHNKHKHYETIGKQLHEANLLDNGQWIGELLYSLSEEGYSRGAYLLIYLINRYYPKVKSKREQEILESFYEQVIYLGDLKLHPRFSYELIPSYQNLGDLYMQRGGIQNYERAEKYYLKLLFDWEEVYHLSNGTSGKKDLANTCNRLGMLYKELGGEKNYRKSEEMYQRSLKLREELCEELKTSKSKADVARTCNNLGMSYMDLDGEENYLKSEDVSQRGMMLIKEMFRELRTNESQADVARTCKNLGDLYYSMRGEENYRKSEEMYRRSLMLYEELNHELRSIVYKREVASLCQDLGVLYMGNGGEENYCKSEEMHRRSLIMFEELYQELRTTASKADVAMICNTIGILYMGNGGEENYRKAEVVFRRSLMLKEELYQELRTTKSKEDVAKICYNLGMLYYYLGGEANYGKSEEMYRRSLMLREELYQELKTTASKADVAKTCHNLGLLYKALGGEENYGKSEEMYRRSLTLREELYQELRTTESKESVSFTYNYLGNLYITIGGKENYRKAEKLYRRSMKFLEELYEELKTSESKVAVARTCNNLGIIYMKKGGEENYRKAEDIFLRSLILNEELYRELRTSETKADVASTCNNLGNLYMDLGGEENYRKSEAMYQKSLTLKEELYQELNTNASKADVANTCHNLGVLYMDLGGEENYRKSEEVYQRSLKLREELYQELKTTASKVDVASTCNILGLLYSHYEGEENYRRSIDMCRKSLTLKEELYEELNTTASKADVADTCNNLGILYRKLGGEENYRKSEAMYQRSLKLREELYQELKTSESKADVANICGNLGVLFENRSDLPQAEQYYLRALDLKKEVHQELQTAESKQEVLDSEQDLFRLRTAMKR